MAAPIEGPERMKCLLKAQGELPEEQRKRENLVAKAVVLSNHLR
jgi:hypothetical protein